MIGKGQNHGLSVILCESQGFLNGIVPSQCVADYADRIIRVGCPIDFAGFDEQQKTFVVLRKQVDCFSGHFRQRRFLRAKNSPVKFVGHVILGKHPPDFSG